MISHNIIHKGKDY
jgi:hypothetical protein